MITMLQMMLMELMALDRPTSDFSSPVKAGAAEAMGLNTRITRACRTSSWKGSIAPDKVMYVVTTVVAFYFGTQHEKKVKE